jgi:hypothetical protein
MPFFLNMEYPRNKLGRLHECEFMHVMNFCMKMFIHLFSNVTAVCFVALCQNMLSVDSEMIQ